MKTETRTKILAYVKERGPHRPFLIGPLAIALGWASVKDTEEWVGELVHEGVVRPITRDEQRQFGLTHAFLPV